MLCSVTESPGSKASTPGPFGSWRSEARCRASSCELLRSASRLPRSCATAQVTAPVTAQVMATLISTMRSERQIVNITAPGQNFKTKISNEPASFQFDRAFNLDRQPDGLHRQRHFCRQCFVTFQPAAGYGSANCLFDFALRGDADLLEKFAHTHVENVFVHDRLSKVPERWPPARHFSRSVSDARGANDAERQGQ